MQNQMTTMSAGMGMGNIMELFKMQVMMKYMGEAKTPQGGFMYMMILMFYDHLSKNFPAIWLWLWAGIQARWNRQTKPPTNLIKPAAEPPKSKEIRAFIQFERDATTKVVDPRIDAVMNYVCQLPEVRSLRFNGTEFIPNFNEPLMIDSDIWFEIITNSKVSVQGQGGATQVVESLVYKLSSYDHDITYLHRFVERSIQNFEQEKKNKLGSETYYFDQVVSVGTGRMKMPVPGGFCAFRKSKFQSNRGLSNIYIRQIDELRGRVEFFLRRRDWYDSKGIPHTLGIMMWGHPGCGKTSTIKAIANETKRHIFNISLAEIKTKDSLKDLFYNETVHVFNGDKLEQLTIPLKQRLYVVEDIDAMSSVVIKRGFQNKEAEEKKAAERAKKEELMKKLGREDEAGDDELDLSTLLNVLDGVRETPGRIIVLSTNYPERLDEALLRPGRFDVILEYEKHSRAVLKTHIEGFYDVALSAEQAERIEREEGLEKKWTPAEVSQILFKNITNVDAALDDLVEKEPEELFRFSQMKEVGGGAGSAGSASNGSLVTVVAEQREESEGDTEEGGSEKSVESEKTDPKVTLDMKTYAETKESFDDFIDRIKKEPIKEKAIADLKERIAFRNENTQKMIEEGSELIKKGKMKEFEVIHNRVNIRNENTKRLETMIKNFENFGKDVAVEYGDYYAKKRESGDNNVVKDILDDMKFGMPALVNIGQPLVPPKENPSWMDAYDNPDVFCSDDTYAAAGL